MSAGLFTVEVRIATAGTQFSIASPVVTFAEYSDINTRGPGTHARLVGYYYNAGGGAVHDVTVFLNRPGAANSDQRVLLDERLASNNEAVNSLTNVCGPDGIVVPKQFGIYSTVQPPVGAVQTGETYQLFVLTAGKNSAATFGAWYSIEGS